MTESATRPPPSVGITPAQLRWEADRLQELVREDGLSALAALDRILAERVTKPWEEAGG